MSGPQGGSADEVRAMLTALSEWVARAMPAPPSGHPGPECQWCPLCQFASALRGERPEVTDRIVETGAAVTGALRSLLDSTGADSTGADSTGADRTGADSTARPDAAERATAPRRQRPPGSRPRPRPDGPA